MDVDVPPASPPSPLSALRESARGWHKVQIAVLGFIGLCGVLLDGWTTQPRWLQLVAGALVLASLVLACLATYLIGRAAWPVSGFQRSSPRDGDEDSELARAGRQLTVGLTLTFVAVGCVALATATAWWPQQADPADQQANPGDPMQVQGASESLCGRLEEGRARALNLDTERGRVVIPLEAVVSVRPVQAC